ncbi:MAG: phosphate ABC transporter substrate-binding protein PstS [Candidatus Dormibacteraceae bacterium]
MSLITQTRRAAVLLVATFLIAACGGVSGGGSAATPAPKDVGSGALTGAGATFPEPFYAKAFYQYSQAHSQVTVNYQAVGSGAGIQQFTKNTVDFGASDVPMTDSELTAAGGSSSLIQMPSTLGVVSMAYNLPGIDKLQLDGAAIAGIFLGNIKKWNDPALLALNSGAKLPSKDITVVHRSDGSGTTYAFSDYLAKQSDAWKAKPGVGKALQWPVGVGGKGNDGVANGVKTTDGAIGYVELAYVIQAQMQQAYVKNKAGKFLQATIDGATAAAAKNTSVSAANFSITDQPGDTSYPITTFSWIFIRTSQSDAAKGKAVVYLFDWLVTDGQQYGRSLQYAPLPKAVQDYAVAQLKLVQAGGSPILK